MQPPEGPPVCTALIVPPSGAPPPISSTMVRSGMPIGTSTRPVLRILPARAKTLVPLLLAVPIAANQSAPLLMIGGDVGERLDVVDERRAFPQPLLGGIGRPRLRRAALALDRGHQGRLLAADERPGADAQVDAEIERRIEDAGAQQAELPRLLDGDLQPMNRQRIFAADVDVALRRRRRHRRRWPCLRARDADRFPARCGP